MYRVVDMEVSARALSYEERTPDGWVRDWDQSAWRPVTPFGSYGSGTPRDRQRATRRKTSCEEPVGARIRNGLGKPSRAVGLMLD